MNIVRLALAVLLMVCGNALLAREAMEATLVVPDVRILPGVPFDFWVELHNPSDSVRRISVCAPFQTRLISGEPVTWTETPQDAQSRLALHWEADGEAVLAPGETKSLAISASRALRSGGFFRQRVLSAPGRRFAIALPLCEQVVGPSGNPLESSTLMTNEVEIEIVNPSGSDARVWNLIEETSNRRWTPDNMESPESRPMWESVLRDFPDSNYVPYAVLMTGRFLSNDWRDCLALQLRTIQRFSDSPVIEWLHVEAWQMARALRQHGLMLAEGAIVRRSVRPTTRLLAFGNDRR